jgi:F-type H+-transporting ATPase subunit delta
MPTKTRKPAGTARKFAKAIVDLAREQNSLESTMRELNTIKEAMQKVPPLKIIFLEKIVSPNQKKKIIKELSDAYSFSNLTTSILFYLVEKKRFFLFNDIVRACNDMFDRLSNLVRASAIVAEPSLANTARKKVEQIISHATGMKAICETKTDPSLIGGAVVKIGDLSIDASIAGILKKMREELI